MPILTLLPNVGMGGSPVAVVAVINWVPESATGGTWVSKGAVSGTWVGNNPITGTWIPEDEV